MISSYCFGHARQFVLAEKSQLKVLTTLHETARSNPWQSILHRHNEDTTTEKTKIPLTVNWPMEIISALTFWGPSQPSHANSSKFSHCTEFSALQEHKLGWCDTDGGWGRSKTAEGKEVGKNVRNHMGCFSSSRGLFSFLLTPS